MAQNELAPGIGEYLAVPSGVKSGNPVLIGATLVGVAQTDRDSAGYATVQIRPGTIWNLSVKGVDGGGNSAVAIGDKLYITLADTPPISKKTSGVLFGKALGAVTGGATATIPVELVQV